VSTNVEPRRLTTTPRLADRVFRIVVSSGGFTTLLVLGLITVFLGVNSAKVFQTFGLDFITQVQWIPNNPEDPTDNGAFGIGAMLVGTLLTSLIALALALPVSVALALYLTQYVPKVLRTPLTILVDLMAAIPSIVYGLWGYFVLMPHAIYWAKLLHKHLAWIPLFDVPAPIFERSPFVAGLVLAVMIVPIITAIAREVFSQAPRDRIEAAYALGATKWAAIRTVVLPHGKAGIAGGAMLGLGRAMGETVAVYLVLNIVFDINWKMLASAGGSVASMIVNKFGEATEFEIQGLMAAGLVLFLLTLFVNFLADLVVRYSGKGA
jgi:phosphate transport system permease protein